jgi:hypothetical protein
MIPTPNNSIASRELGRIPARRRARKYIHQTSQIIAAGCSLFDAKK